MKRLNPSVLRHLLGRKVTNVDVGRLLLVALVGVVVGVACMWGCADRYWSRYWRDEADARVAEAEKRCTEQAAAAVANVDRAEIRASIAARARFTEDQRRNQDARDHAALLRNMQDHPLKSWGVGGTPQPMTEKHPQDRRD